MREDGGNGGSVRWTLATATPWVLALASVLSGCVGDGDDDVTDPARRVGWIDLAETSVGGIYVNQVAATFWREPGEGGAACGRQVEQFADGECTVMRTEAPVCPSACAAGEVCTWMADCSGGECVPTDSPRAPLQAGEIHITGGSARPDVTGRSNAAGTYEFDVPSSDWWADGDALTVSATGDSFPAFSLVAETIPAPHVTTDVGAWTADTFTSGNDIPVEWTAGDDGSHSVVVALLTDVAMICVTADDGHFDVPGDGIAALGASPASWAVAVDASQQHVINEGADGQLTVTIGTSGAAALVFND